MNIWLNFHPYSWYLLWLSWSLVLSNYDRPIPYREFFQIIWVSDLNRASRTVDLTRACEILKKFSEPIFQHWNWWCRLSIFFIKLDLDLNNDYSTINITWWALAMTFLHFNRNSRTFLFSKAVKGILNDRFQLTDGSRREVELLFKF